jgi:hypothetical protein
MGTRWVFACVLAACGFDDSGRDQTGTFGPSTVTVGPLTATTASDATTDGSSDGSTDATSVSATSPSDDDDDDDASDATGVATTSGPPDPDSTSTGDPPTGGCPPQGPLDCGPGPGSGEADTCDLDGVSCFLPTVQASVQGVVNGNPAWFDMSAGTPFVLEPELYMNAAVDAVAATGLCAIRDPNAGDEIAVKHDQGYAESFDILSAEGNARWGDGIYTATCSPAWF